MTSPVKSSTRLLILSAVLLVACGNKGDLYLPVPPATPAPATQDAPEPDPEPDTAASR